MRSVIEALYGEFLERDLPPFTRRQIDVEPVRGKAMVFMGMRRAGKTYLCYQRMKDLLDQGVPKAHILYLNFEDDRLYGFSLGDCQTILDVFYRENPSKKEADCHFFFDEIQNIDGWERFIRRILDTERASVYVTGSSARLLSTEIATGLRGRSLTREVFPYSFEEYLRAGGLSGNFRLPGAKTRLLLEGKANAYLETGGFPEVFGCPPDRRREILQSYIDAVILRDVVERHGVRNVEALRALVQQVLCHPATRFSIHKFHRDLQSRGLRIGKDDLYAFTSHLADAHLLFPVPLWTRSASKRQANPKKVYLVDNGLAAAWASGITPDHGTYLENAVFLALRRKGITPGYYVTQKGREVDFAYKDGPQTVLVQAAYALGQDSTREREWTALREAAGEVQNPRCLVVTLLEEKPLAEGITTVPLWKFLLGLG